ncbi:MAG: tetratricopeptide repeat protein, partial [Planctomycetes bacterium]|nr:tetratricopeptide repeat protein [Planctomycetota bacterium]
GRHWGTAIEAVRRAEEFGKSRDASSDLSARAAEARARIERESAVALRSRELVERFAGLRPHHGDDRDAAELDAAFVSAFEDAGVDLRSPVESAAGSIAESQISSTLVAALDQWSRFRRRHRVDAALAWRKLHEIAIQADADPWRTELRRAFEDRDLERLRAMSADADRQELDAESFDLLASCLADLGDRDKAVDLYRRAVDAHPEDYQLVHNLAAILESLESPPRAEITRLCWIGVALRPNSAHALTDLGLALLTDGQPAKALQFLDRSETIEPEHPRTALLRGVALQQAGRVSAAVDAYAIAARGGKPKVLAGYAALLAQVDRVEDAIAASRRAHQVEPSEFRHSLQLARFLGTAARHAEVIELLTPIASSHPDVADLQCVLGGALLEVGRFEESAESFRRALDVGTPEQASRSEAWLANAEQFVEASAEYEQWTRDESMPKDAEQIAWLARVACRKGDDAAALRLFDQALAFPREIDPRRILGLYLEAGLTLARVVATDPNSLASDRELAPRGISWFETWVDGCRQFVGADVPAFDLLGGTGVTRFRLDPAVESFGSRIRADGDESFRARWKQICEAVEEFRASVLPDGTASGR